MDEGRFAPPLAAVETAAHEVPVPAAVLKKIRNAWIACLVSATMTLVFAVGGIAGFSLVELLDVGLILGMAWGISRRSRTCAVVMFVYFVISKALMFAGGAPSSGLFMGLVFLYLFGQGVAGTFAYHKLVREAPIAVAP